MSKIVIRPSSAWINNKKVSKKEAISYAKKHKLVVYHSYTNKYIDYGIKKPKRRASGRTYGFKMPTFRMGY